MDRIVGLEGKLTVVESTSQHVEDIYPYMRKADQIEVACMDSSPKESLQRGLETSDVCLTVKDAEGVPFAMFGVGQIAGMAYIWLLGTESVNDNAYDFLRASRKYTQALAKPYGAVTNFVHEENKVALKWLKFCGAKFLRRHYFNNKPFFEFVITKNHV